MLVLEVACEDYSMAIVPNLKSKIPRDSDKCQGSKESNHEWMIGEFLEKLWQELSIRGTNGSQEKSGDRAKEGRLLFVSRVGCVYFLGNLLSKDCGQVTDLWRRKDSLMVLPMSI